MDPVRPFESRETLRAPAARRDARRRRGDGAFRVPEPGSGEDADPQESTGSDASSASPLPVSAPLDDEAGTRLDLSA